MFTLDECAGYATLAEREANRLLAVPAPTRDTADRNQTEAAKRFLQAARAYEVAGLLTCASQCRAASEQLLHEVATNQKLARV
jgi:hypothetical protein